MKNTGTKKTQQQGCCGLHDTLNKDLIIVKSSNGAKLNLFFFFISNDFLDYKQKILFAKKKTLFSTYTRKEMMQKII
jgi:hypothetical protein